MPIRSKCPKCGEEGSQSITFKPSKSNPRWQYLTVVHGKGKRCFIGRARTAEEFMGEMNKPEIKEEYKEALETMVKEVRQIANEYSKAKSGSVRRIVKSLEEIITRYGY